MSSDVFISYSSKDADIADAACAAIEAVGLRCWIAPRDIIAGEDWPGAILRGINSNRVLVLIFSANANSSHQIKREVERAVNRGMPVIPFRIEDLQPSHDLELFISSLHWLNAYPPPMERHLEALAKAVQRLLEVPPADDIRGIATGVPTSRGVKSGYGSWRRRLRYVRTALTGALVASILAGLIPAKLRQTSWGQKIDFNLYGYLYATSIPAEATSSRPHLWVVNIASINRGAVTDRKALRDLIHAIAERRPSAIGIDVNLAPVEPGGKLTQDDRLVLDECLRISEQPRGPGLPPTHVAVAIDTRTQFGDYRAWLGDERYWQLAATALCPAPAQGVRQSDDVNSRASDTDPTDPWMLPLEHPDSLHTLPGFAAALVPERTGNWRDFEGEDVPLVPQVLLRFLPDFLRHWLSVPGDALIALPRKLPMAKKDQPGFGWFALGPSDDEPAPNSFWALDCYWVNYRTIDSLIGLYPEPVPTHRDMEGSIVLIGDASPNPNSTDIFARPPVRDQLPGVVCHACGVTTLLDEPIVKMAASYLNWLDALAAGVSILVGEAAGFAFFAVRRKPVARTFSYLVCIRIFSAGLIWWRAVSLWNRHIVWTEAVWPIGAVLLLLVISTIRRALAHDRTGSNTNSL